MRHGMSRSSGDVGVEVRAGVGPVRRRRREYARWGGQGTWVSNTKAFTERPKR